MAPRFVHPETNHTIETSHRGERVSLLAQGYREQAARTKAVKQADEAKTANTDSK